MAAEMKVTKDALRAAMNSEFCGHSMRDALMSGTDHDYEVLEAALNAALAAMLEPVAVSRENDKSRPSFYDIVRNDSQEAEMWAYDLIPLY